MNDEVWPAQTEVKYKFPGTKYTTGKVLPITWYDGGLLPGVGGSHVPQTAALPRSGSLFIGEKGSLVLPHVGAPKVYTADKDILEFKPAEDLNHYHGFVEGCITGKQPSDGFDYGSRLTEAVLLGNIAVRYRTQTLKWDAQAFEITNLKEANQWLTRDYRQGWQIAPVV
jgi:hypothetical protein